MEQTTIAQLAQNVVTALNSLILADEMISQPRAIFKIVRFKEWLKQTVKDFEKNQTADNEDDDSELLEESAQDAQNESENRQPGTINFD